MASRRTGMARAIDKFNQNRKTMKDNTCPFCVKGKIGKVDCASCRGTGKKTV